MTWLTGPSVSPWPCVNTSRSLIQLRLGSAAGVELPGRQHHLPAPSIDVVAVVVDRHEVVIRANLLNLPEGLEQRLVIPEPHVVQRLAIALDVGARQLRVAGDLELFDPIQRKPLPRRRDVVDDVRRFAHLLVGRDDEALQGGRVEPAADEHDGVERHGAHERPSGTIEDVDQRQHGADGARGRERQRRGHPRVDVGVAGALNDAGR